MCENSGTYWFNFKILWSKHRIVMAIIFYFKCPWKLLISIYLPVSYPCSNFQHLNHCSLLSIHWIILNWEECTDGPFWKFLFRFRSDRKHDCQRQCLFLIGYFSTFSLEATRPYLSIYLGMTIRRPSADFWCADWILWDGST